MRVRMNQTSGQIEARCTTCSTWKHATTANFYYSTDTNSRIRAYGEQHVVAIFADQVSYRPHLETRSDFFRPQCRQCEHTMQRARRANGGNRAARRSGNRGRAFGVELELTGPSSSRIIAAITPIVGRVVTRGYAATNGNSWELKHDGSVHGEGLELVSPKLYGEQGLETLKQVCYALQQVGATVDRSAGCHVHVDFRGMEFTRIQRQLLSVLRNQDNMLRMVAPSRRNGGYNPSWRPQQVDQFAALASTTDLRTAYMGPRGSVNLQAYPRHGSVEFRSHGGTTNFAKLGAWVRFLLAALAYGETSTATTAFATPAEWLQALNMNATDSEQLLRFETAAMAAAQSLESDEYAGRR